MKKEIIINATNEETSIAILEDDRLVELFLEQPEAQRMVGDIYKGKMSRVLPGMQAAFIDIGLEQNAFLHFSDVSDATNQFLRIRMRQKMRKTAGNGWKHPRLPVS